MTITSSSFVQDIILFLRDLLREELVDPLFPNRENFDFVLTAYPKKNIKYPLITIKQTNLEINKMGMSSEVCRANVYLELRIWARNSKEADKLLSQVIDELRTNIYGTDGTTEEGIFNFDITSVNTVVEDKGDNSIHSKIINLNYFAILGQ